MPKDNVSLFDVFGPVMIGPSSSHTAGVARIAFLSRKMFGFTPDKVRVRFFGSLASTYKGHGSDNAVIAGLLEIPPSSEDLSHGKRILENHLKEKKGFAVEILCGNDMPKSWHPNTLSLELFSMLDGIENRLSIRAASIGGGAILINEVNGYEVNLSGENEAILVLHIDEVGVIAGVTKVLAENEINIAFTSSHRKEKGQEALLVVEVDGIINSEVINKIEELSPVFKVIKVPSLAEEQGRGEPA